MRLFARRQLLRLAGAATAGLALPRSFAQALPFDQPKFFYGFPAGSAGDIACRRVAERIGGTPYARNRAVVENRPGAGGRIALEALKGSPADGATLCMSPYPALSIYPHVYRKMNYDAFADFIPVGTSSVIQHGLALGPTVPASVTDVRGFIAWAKANPDKATYGSPAAGSTPHFLGALLGLSQNADLKHVAYRGSVPGIADLVGGQISSMLTPAGDFLPYHRAGRIRLIATSGRSRLPFANEVRTFAEQGFGDFVVEEWFGFHAPARTPAAVVQTASQAIATVVRDPGFAEALANVGLLPLAMTSEEMLRSQRAEFERWGPLVKQIGFTADS